MGVTIRCQATGQGIDMGSGGFLRLRRKVSDLVGEPWASHYRTLTDASLSVQDEAWFEEFDRKTARLLAARKIRVKTLSFLLQSDMEGYLPPGACRQLLETIGDYDDNIIYGYAGQPHPAMFRHFKALLEDCVRCRCRLVWN